MPYLQSPIGCVHVEIPRATDDLGGDVVAHGERHRAEFLAHPERGLDVRAGLVRRGRRRIPKTPQLAVGRGAAQIRFVLSRERLERRMPSLERYRLDERHTTAPTSP